MSTLQWATLGLLVLAALTGIWRVLRLPGSRRWIGVIGQPVMAILLWLVLYPPLIDKARVEAVILSPGVTAQQLAQLDSTSPIIALPGVVVADRLIERVPDLATALRRNPSIGDLRVLGDGLPERDRDRESPGQRGLSFEPGADLFGLVDVQSPAMVRAGSLWTMQGIVAGVNAGQVRLLDRSAAVAADAIVDESGRFHLSVAAKTAGEAVYRLQVLDAKDSVIDELPLGVVIRAGDSLNTLILAGAADPETKYLRRWIIDSGSTVSSRISLSRGITQRQNDIDLSAVALEQTDLLIVDERAWAGLSASSKALITAAVEQGMGLILRASGPVPAKTRTEWAELGFQIENADLASSAHVVDAGHEIELTRMPLRMTAEDSVPLLRATDGSVLALWRAFGQGRIALWLPFDSWRLSTSGDKTRYGTLWSEAFSTLARARGSDAAALPRMARVDQRAVICGIGPDAAIENDQGQHQRLLIDSEAGNCAAWWPMQAGWQHFVDAGRREPIFVLAADEASNLIRQETRAAARQLVRQASAATTYRAPMQRWPLFLAWLLICAGFWWWQRRQRSTLWWVGAVR